MRGLVLLSTMSIFVLCVLAGTALAQSDEIDWTYKYDCDDYPTLSGWILLTGFSADMGIIQDPDDPANNLLHITSVDGPDLDTPDEGDKTLYSRNRPQVRIRYNWNADPNLGVTVETRVREAKGGLFAEIFDGGHVISMETKPPYEFWELWSGLTTDMIFLDEWNVLRVTMSAEGFMLYANGDLILDGTGQVFDHTENKIRIGHSGGSGPEDGSPADIWMDYMYWDTRGAWAPGEEPWTAVEGGSWGKIKALF